jgi:hypothetical protein
MHEELEITSEPPRLLGLFWLIAGSIGLWAGFSFVNGTDAFAGPALVVASAALFPAYVWCARRVPGIPVFPLFAATFLLTHAFPLLQPTARVQGYAEAAIWQAAITVAGFLWLSTATWWVCAARPRRTPSTCLSLGGDRGHALYLSMLAATTALSVATNADWFSSLSEGVFTTLRGFVRGLTGVAILMLALSWGRRTLSPASVKSFVVLFILFSVADAASLFLVGAIVASLMLAVGFVLGRGRLPAIALLAVAIFAVLHLGKGVMRERYWSEGSQGHVIQPFQYPALYVEWVQASLENVQSADADGERSASIFARASNINILLQVQEMSPRVVPYLGGETYAIIGSSLLPRLLFPDKASPHLGSAILNVHYGNQTWESSQSTTIGWGLLNESIANFGVPGWIGLAICIGLFYGVITRLSTGVPSDSVQLLVGVFTMGFAIQTEWTASVFLSAYAQGLFSFLAVALVFAQRVNVDTSALAPRPPAGWDDPDTALHHSPLI